MLTSLYEMKYLESPIEFGFAAVFLAFVSRAAARLRLCQYPSLVFPGTPFFFFFFFLLEGLGVKKPVAS